MQSRFPHRSRWQWTWEHTSCSCAQLDHILVNSKWVRPVTNSLSYNTPELISDHCILTARFSIQFRSSKGTKSKRLHFAWEKLTQTPGRQADFAVAISNRFDAPSLPDDDVQVLYSGIVSSAQNAAEEVPGKPSKRSTHLWVSARTEELVHIRPTPYCLRVDLSQKTHIIF